MSTRPTLVGIVALVTLCLIAGCPGTTEGLDLATRGGVTIRITRQVGSGQADASAVVYDSLARFIGNPNLTLQSTQHFSVDGAALAATWVAPAYNLATVAAVNPSGAYTIAFNNAGTLTQMQAGPPTDVAITSPTNSETVARSGFTVTWNTAPESGVVMGLSVSGRVPDPNSPGGSYTSTVLYRGDLPDTGTTTIGAADLSTILPGEITLRVWRERVVPQALGFAEGQATINVWQERTLTLGN